MGRGLRAHPGDLAQALHERGKALHAGPPHPINGDRVADAGDGAQVPPTGTAREQAKAPETARFQAPFYLPWKNLMSFGRDTS